jgi:hypothetical protein
MSILTAFGMRRSRWATAVLLAAAVALPRETRAQAKACARTATGTWTVTGVVAAGQTLGACSANANWSRVVPLNMTAASAPTGNATASGQIAFTRFADHLFVGIVVDEDQDLSDLDRVVLVFDKEADGTANAGDFFLRIDVGPAIPITSAANAAQAACQFTATVHYYAFDAGQGFFVEQPSNVASATIAKVAYDYDTSGDPETHLWNIEIDMPLNRNINGTNFYPLKTAAPFFKMGAYVFADQGHLQQGEMGNVLRWPSTMQERQITDWDQNAPAWVPTQLADIDLNDVCFNVSLAATLEPTPWSINGAANPDGSAHLNPFNQDNSFRVRFFYQGPGTSAANGPNDGQVRVTVMPFNGSSFDPAWQPAPVNVHMDQYNQHYTADFFAPANTFPNTMQWACSDLFLQNFTHDDDQTAADNHIHINHNYIHTSDFTQPIAISAAGIPGLTAGQTTHVVINLNATNDPSKPRGALGPFEIPRPRAPVLFLFAAAALALVGAATLRRRRPIAATLAGGAAILIAAGCHKVEHGGGNVGNGRWEIQNGDSLGIVRIPDKPGWYRMPIRQGEVKTLNVHFGDAPLPYKTRVEHLQFHSDSAPNRIRVAVQPGRLITIVATGLVDVDGKNGPTRPINPAGFSRVVTTPGIAARASARGYLLSPAYDNPAQNVGTLIGSFDDFKSSFVIGTNASIAVPNAAQQLTIAINALPADYRVGDGVYEVNIVDTPGPHVPTSTPIAFDTPIDHPWFVPPWLVLTAMNVHTFYEVPVTNPKTNTTLTGLSFLGEAHVTVYRSSQ